jgi:dynamin 1-like protein
MDQLIPIASKLQDVLGALGQTTTIDLPQIVVVGGQSSGKSSVLESIVGRSFLPRGTGIVTRRPLILQLYNTQQVQTTASDDTHDENAPSVLSEKKTNSDSQYTSSDEWGEFLHTGNRKYHDFGEIRKEIVRETERLTGKNKGVDAHPIHLKIFSPTVLALTLVDLPGVAKIAVGDQPVDIEQQIHAMCLQFISNPNAIILAVTSANTDLANSDAIKMAQQVDPAGKRTVGVLTKLDLMDPGTDCADILMNKVIPLRRGYIGVVNRGQKDVVTDLSIRHGLKKEEQFFKKHPSYSRNPTLLNKCGTARLSKALNIMLMHHIRECLPDLKGRIAHMMTDVQQELDALGSPTHNASRSTRGAALLGLLSKFATNFAAVLEGRGGQDLGSINSSSINNKTNNHATSFAGPSELIGGARIGYIFNEVFARSLTSVGAFDDLTDEEIRVTICNANGTRRALFVPEISFDILVRRQVSRLEQPGIQCVDLVYDELQRIASQSEPKELTRFPNLRDRMVEVVSSLLKRCVSPTQMMVSNLVRIELAYINTNHPDFLGGSEAVARLMAKIASENQENNTNRAIPYNQGGVNATPLTTTTPSNKHRHEGNSDDSIYKDAESAPESPMENTSGGILGLIFRGGPPDKPKPRRAQTPNEKGPPTVVHLPQVPDTMKQTDMPPTEREQVEMEVIKSLVESYFAIVRKNFIDLVPKTICYFLVNHVKDSLQNELVSELYREAEVGSLMQEAEDIAARRQTCTEMKDLLSKALEIVNEVRDFNTFK